MSIVDEVRSRIARALERPGVRPPSGRLLVACSGGPDSRTLLDALAALASPLHLTLAVASVDHQRRAESADEVRKVVLAARALGLPATALAVDLRGPSMAAARRARYDALVACAMATRAEAIVVGHTATDQAETFLDRVVRGAGLRGLSAMMPSRPIAPGVSLLRPMLLVTHADVEAYVAARALAVARDPTNDDRSYRRSRLRHEVLPHLRRERADLDRAVAELCERLACDAEHLDDLAAQSFAALCGSDGSLDVARLRALPDAVAVRVVARAAKVPLGRLHLEAIRRLCVETRGTRSISLPSGVVAERRYGQLHFGALARDPGDLEIPVTGPGRYALLGTTLELSPALYAAAQASAGALFLRNLRPGDRLRASNGTRKVQDLLVDAKVPRPERRRIPLLVRRSGRPGPEGEEEVLLIAGVRACASLCSLTEGLLVQ